MTTFGPFDSHIYLTRLCLLADIARFTVHKTHLTGTTTDTTNKYTGNETNLTDLTDETAFVGAVLREIENKQIINTVTKRV